MVTASTLYWDLSRVRFKPYLYATRKIVYVQYNRNRTYKSINNHGTHPLSIFRLFVAGPSSSDTSSTTMIGEPGSA